MLEDEQLGDSDRNEQTENDNMEILKKVTSKKSSFRNPASHQKLEFDATDLLGSAEKLINYLPVSSIAKRDVGPIVAFIRNWTELYTIQSIENKTLTEKNEILTSNKQIKT